MKTTLITLLLITIILPVAVIAYDKNPGAIADRIRSVGNVCVEGQACANQTATATATTANQGQSPETVYTTYCAVCHNAGVAGAPMLTDAAVWTTRLEKSIDTVYNNAIGGIGGMPAKGMCMNCSDDDIRTTVDYMIKESGAE